jgi:hypothetical protein
MRLFNNRVMEIEDEKDLLENSEENEDDDDENDHSRLKGKSRLKNGTEKEKIEIDDDYDEELSAGDLTSIFQSKKVLNNALNDRAIPSSIKSLKMIFNIVVISIITMACINQFYTDNKYKVGKE